jgi:hypothetical protein
MKALHDPDAIITAWLEDGPLALPDASRRVVASSIHLTPQRRGPLAWLPWRDPAMNGNSMRVAAAAAVALLILVGGGIYLANRSSGGVGAPPATTPSPSPTAAAQPSPASSASPTPASTAADTTGWLGFSSDRYGYDTAYPPTWVAQAAMRDWSLDLDRGQNVNPGADHFVGGPDGDQIGVTVFSAAGPAAMSNDDWIAAYLPTDRPTCSTTDMWETVTVDGQTAMLEPSACGDDQAFVFIGKRAYVFSIWRTDQVPLLKGFLSTVRFHADAQPGASPSASP